MKKDCRRVLIVGDWLVDEHWVVGEHRSDSASRTGQKHSRALHRSSCCVRSLCGAGQVATILYNATRGEKPLYDITGFGMWHPGDTEELTVMLDPKQNVANTPHRLVPIQRSGKKMVRAKLFNLATRKQNEKVGTTRVIRVYDRSRSQGELNNRLDWELWLTHADRTELAKGVRKFLKGLADRLGDFDHIVVKDLGKGVVTRELISALAARSSKKATWYVSSKQWKPNWFSDLPKKRVRLLLIPQLAARNAIRDEYIESSTWMTVGGGGSREAIAALSGLSKDFPRAHVVVLPNAMSVLARDPANPGKAKSARVRGYMQRHVGNLQRSSVVPMASVFFPALITELLDFPGSRDFLATLKRSLDFTNAWMRHEYRRVLEDNWRPLPEQNPDLAGEPRRHFDNWREFDWVDAGKHWDQSSEKQGIVRYESESGREIQKLQLWRAMTEIDGYVACAPSKRHVLKSLVEHGRLFNAARSTHMAFMLVDTPGSGKSYLVQRLARKLQMRFLSFNITQMLTRNDLMQCFDKIVTSQSQSPNESFLVFIDEINASIEGQHVYDAFLAPLEDGIYTRSGNSFHIRPCFWVFAGTRMPSTGDNSDKGSDFETRLTRRPPFEMTIDPKMASDVKGALLERTYVGAAMILRFFPDVRRVSRKVLEAINILPGSMSAREIGQFVKGFRNVQYGMVTSMNLRPTWSEDHDVQPEAVKDWNKKWTTEAEEAELVILELDPADDALEDL